MICACVFSQLAISAFRKNLQSMMGSKVTHSIDVSDYAEQMRMMTLSTKLN